MAWGKQSTKLSRGGAGTNEIDGEPVGRDWGARAWERERERDRERERLSGFKCRGGGDGVREREGARWVRMQRRRRRGERDRERGSVKIFVHAIQWEVAGDWVPDTGRGFGDDRTP
jgi:hypothetical protein